MTFLAHWKIGGGSVDELHDQVAIDSVSGGSGDHNGIYKLSTFGEGLIFPYGVDGKHLRSNIYGFGIIHNVNNISDLMLTGEMSFMAWFMKDYRYALTDGTYLACVGANGATQNDNYQWMVECRANGIIRMFWENGVGVSVTVDSIANILTEQAKWYHLAVIRYEISPNIYGVKYYVDGALVDTNSTGFSPPDGGSNSVCYIGRRAEGASLRDCHIDSVRIYDTDESVNVSDIYDAEVDLVSNLSIAHSGPRLLAEERVNAGFHR